MPQLGTPYTLVGPDGTRAVFNSPTDPDFVGYLDSDNGVTGLLDTADVRESYMDHVEAHGGSQANNFFSRKTGTLQGVIVWPDTTSLNFLESQLKRASRGMGASAPAILSWTPDGSITRQMRVWRQGKVTITGRRLKNFIVPLASPDAFAYSQQIFSQVIAGGSSGGEVGFSSPISSPLTSVFGATSQSTCANGGDAETWPSFRIDGPVTNPRILNNTTGLSFTLGTNLDKFSFLLVDSKFRTVLRGTKVAGGTINQATNPSFEGGVGTAGYTQTAATGSAAVASDATAPGSPDGVNLTSVAVETCPGTNAGEGLQSPTTLAATSGTSNTVSWYVRIMSGTGNLTLTITERDAAGAVIGSTTAPVALTADGLYHRVSVTRAFGGTGVKQSFSIATTAAAACTFRVDAIQAEQGAAPTLYVDGDLSGGTWLGSTDASQSQRLVDQAALVSQYSIYAQNFSINTWWPLQPGTNDVRFLASAYQAGSQLTVNWRYAWE